MGNSESSSQFPSREDVSDQGSVRARPRRAVDEEGESQSWSGLKVGAAVAGTALLTLGALSLASSSGSGDSDGRRTTMAESQSLELEVGRSGGRGGGHPRNSGPSSYHLREANQHLVPRMIKIMTYNVWFHENVEVDERMNAIGGLIQQHSPDVIFFQEVTPYIYKIFQCSNWWKAYKCSVSPDKATRGYFCMLLSKLPVSQFICRRFENSTMGRELCVAEINVGMDKKLVAATSHLESPTPPEMHSTKRVAQAREAVSLLKDLPNAIFGGDMNWAENSDGPFPLQHGWVDAWADLRPTENGWTYDTKSNQMLRGNYPLQKRLDRFICKLRDFEMISVNMIGMEAIPGLLCYKKKKVLPVLPSDHYGLLLTIRPI